MYRISHGKFLYSHGESIRWHTELFCIVTFECNDIMFFLLSLHGSYSHRSNIHNTPSCHINVCRYETETSLYHLYLLYLLYLYSLLLFLIISARSSYTIRSLTQHISSPHGNINGDHLAPAGNCMDNIFGRHL